MQAPSHSHLDRPRSAWAKLKNQEISCAEALQLLVDEQGIVNQSLLDREVSDRFIRLFANKNDVPRVIPLLLWQGCYYLGSPVELSKETIATISQRINNQIKLVPISPKSYRIWYYTQNTDAETSSADLIVNPLTGELEAEDISESTEAGLLQAKDQIARIKTILVGALRHRASDIHMEPTLKGLKVRYRIDGVLRHVTTLPQELSRKTIVALKVMCHMDIAESRCPQDGRIDEREFDAKELAVLKKMDTRVSTLPCVNGEKAVIRLLPKENRFAEIDKIGFTAKTLPIYQKWLQQPQGMIVLTGPTGSGKTSTLYTSLLTIADEDVNVVTVEDPVEYVLPKMTQTQVHEAAGMTFAAGLRAILRQDPDIIMVGEIRDHETAETAVRAALTGHLVLTTLHTNDALGAIPRLKDIGPDPGLISDALLGIVAQRLVRVVCPHCAEPYTPTDEDLKALGIERSQAQTSQWRKGKGCANCFNSGYLGREAIVELLDIDRNLRDVIHEGTTVQLHRHLNDRNFSSFREAALEKVTQGLTTVEEVLRVIPHSAFFTKPVEPSTLGNGHRVRQPLNLVN
ncbi:MAG: GspE/PulE family protein [Cyanosarcina radialis HA8281-LM2]|jgi:type II secretory ATPase GspE/PulE/Tfp pilus assembly ATPase PilB-like protein|nr:GspE/PulE family protein [Cyanosarcina radialis HA8281-LM2]